MKPQLFAAAAVIAALAGSVTSAQDAVVVNPGLEPDNLSITLDLVQTPVAGRILIVDGGGSVIADRILAPGSHANYRVALNRRPIGNVRAVIVDRQGHPLASEVIHIVERERFRDRS